MLLIFARLRGGGLFFQCVAHLFVPLPMALCNVIVSTKALSEQLLMLCLLRPPPTPHSSPPNLHEGQQVSGIMLLCILA